MAIFIPRKKEFWQRKPTTLRQLREGHWLADDLVGAYLWFQGLENLTGRNSATLGGSATLDPSNGAILDANGEYVRIDADVLLADSSDTYTVTQKYQKIIAYGGGYPRLLQRGDGDSARFYRNYNDYNFVFWDANFTASQNIWDGDSHTVSLSCSNIATDYVNTRAVHINAVPEYSLDSDSYADAVYSSGRWMMLGNRPDGTRYNGGGNDFLYLHARDLHSEEIKNLHEAPYQILKPKKTYFFLGAVTAPTATLSGSATASITEVDINDGGKEIILDLTDDTWVAAGTAFDDIRQDILNGLVSAQNEQYGWNNIVTPNEPVTSVVRTSDTRVTITLEAH